MLSMRNKKTKRKRVKQSKKTKRKYHKKSTLEIYKKLILHYKKFDFYLNE
jgi:hypothetical protein